MDPYRNRVNNLHVNHDFVMDHSLGLSYEGVNVTIRT